MISIGDFNQNQPQIIQTDSLVNPKHRWAYIIVDFVRIEQVIDAGPDITKCPYETTLLNATGSNNYTWGYIDNNNPPSFYH
jgi:hypothetical protein